MASTLRNDSIAAIATPQGIGALGIIRISGHDAIEKASLLFPGKNLSEVPSHTLHYGPLVFDNELIDEVIVSIFKGPHSFTGELPPELNGVPQLEVSVVAQDPASQDKANPE